MQGLNLGVDFVGGQMIRATFAQPVDVEQLRGRVGALDVGEASIQEFGGPRSYQIRLPKPEGGEAAANRAATEVRAMLEQQYPGARVDCGRDRCRARSARSWRCDGALAIALAMLGIAIYIWFRFEWQFGVGALVTLFHDVSMTLGFFALTQLQVDLNVVAAFLTIVGYSLNDTVVIYDRIRENLRKYRKMAIVPLLNLSLNETLSRTMVTSLSILLALGDAAALRPGRHLRPDDRDLPRHLRRHLFVDLHLLAGAGLAGGQARQLPADRGRGRAGAGSRLIAVQQTPRFSRVHVAAWPPPRPTLMRFSCRS